MERVTRKMTRAGCRQHVCALGRCAGARTNTSRCVSIVHRAATSAILRVAHYHGELALLCGVYAPYRAHRSLKQPGILFRTHMLLLYPYSLCRPLDVAQEYCDRGSLSRALAAMRFHEFVETQGYVRWDAWACLQTLKEVTKALMFLHENRILHGDLKVGAASRRGWGLLKEARKSARRRGIVGICGASAMSCSDRDCPESF